MKNLMADQVRRVRVTEPIATDGRPFDYADAFEVSVPHPDMSAPREWLHEGLATTSGVVTRLVGVLGLGESPTEVGQLGPFRIIESSAEVIHLEAAIPLMHITMVGRRTVPSQRRLTTVLHFRRPLLGRIAWTIIGPVHRRAAKSLITAATTLRPDQELDSAAGSTQVDRGSRVSGLAFVDEHAVVINAPANNVWLNLSAALDQTFSGSVATTYARVAGCAERSPSGPRPLAIDSTLVGFRVASARPGAELELTGRHRFSVYALSFHMEQANSGQTRLRARTHANFPGGGGRLYRLLVVRTGFHARSVRHVLKDIQRQTESSRGAG